MSATTICLNECAICMEPVDVKNMCVTPCGHTFCFSDLMTWLKQNDGCPCCREGLIPETAEEEEEDDDDEWFSDDEEEDGNTPANMIRAVNLDAYTERFESAGYSLKDALALMVNFIEDPKYTREYIRGIMLKMEEIEETLLDETAPEEEPSDHTADTTATPVVVEEEVERHVPVADRPREDVQQMTCTYEEALADWKHDRVIRRYA